MPIPQPLIGSIMVTLGGCAPDIIGARWTCIHIYIYILYIYSGVYIYIYTPESPGISTSILTYLFERVVKLPSVIELMMLLATSGLDLVIFTDE